MNEKSNPMPMMYKTIPAVAELNKVPGFDPLKFLRHKVSRKTNEEMLQLELPYQKLWFRLRHPQGRMKLTTLRITEQLAIMEARVYLDRSDAEPISSYISQHSAEEGTDYVQAAQDEALSAALSDAGFGLQFADVAVDSTGKVFGSSIPLSGTAPIRQPIPNSVIYSHKIGHFHWYMILVCWNGSSGSMQSRQRNTAGKPTWCCAR